MVVRFSITTTRRSSSDPLNPRAASFADSWKGKSAPQSPSGGGNDAGGKSPYPVGILRLLGKRKPRASHITTARLRLLSALENKAKPISRATRYIPDSPTDSSYEAEKDPDRRVQQAIALVFEKCLELGNAR